MNNHFEVFVAVVESGSYSNAAKKLFKSPSAISKQIAAIEENFSTQLFDRTTRSLALTEAGKVFYEHCKEINQKIVDATTELQSFTGKPVGDIKITWPAGLSYSRIAAALAEFTKQYPEIRLDIRATNDVINIKDQGIDVAFRSSPKDSADLIGVELFRVHPMVCASPEFVAQYGLLDSLDQLVNVPNILPSYMNLAQKSRPVFPQLAQLKLEEQHRADDLPTIINLTKQGVGAAFLIKHMIQRELDEGSLVNLLPNFPVPSLPVYMIFQQSDHLPARMRVFVDFFKAYFLYQSAAD